MNEEHPLQSDHQTQLPATNELGFLDDGFKIKRKSKNDAGDVAMITENLADHSNMQDDPSAVYLKAPEENVTQVAGLHTEP